MLKMQRRLLEMVLAKRSGHAFDCFWFGFDFNFVFVFFSLLSFLCFLSFAFFPLLSFRCFYCVLILLNFKFPFVKRWPRPGYIAISFCVFCMFCIFVYSIPVFLLLLMPVFRLLLFRRNIVGDAWVYSKVSKGGMFAGSFYKWQRLTAISQSGTCRGPWT
jgi:hypothetical protein